MTISHKKCSMIISVIFFIDQCRPKVKWVLQIWNNANAILEGTTLLVILLWQVGRFPMKSNKILRPQNLMCHQPQLKTHICPPVHICTAQGRKIQTSPILTILGHQLGICAKNYKNLPSRFFMGINGLKTLQTI